MKSSEKLLGCYTEELLPCTSFSEFCDVTGKACLLYLSTSSEFQIARMNTLFTFILKYEK